MINPFVHPLTFDPDEAMRLQEDLRLKLILSWDGRSINTVGGIAFQESAGSVVATISVHHYPSLAPIGTFVGEAPAAFPFIAGLLVYRCGPAILDAWQKLSDKPDLLLINAHGIAHPRRMGLASHVGLWLNVPTIGVAKALLYGCESDVGKNSGDWTELVDEHQSKQVIGAVLRTCDSTRPVYVSPGHLIDLPHSIAFVMACCQGHRLPEPIRSAQQAASAAIKSGVEKRISAA